MAELDDIPVTLIDGRETTFGEWAGKVRLVVNVASRCGLTPQYAALEDLQERYADRGFTVLGLPSNQFLQEFGGEDKISEYCSMTWGVTFPMTGKVKVNGRGRHPLYTALTEVPDANGTSPPRDPTPCRPAPGRRRPPRCRTSPHVSPSCPKPTSS